MEVEKHDDLLGSVDLLDHFLEKVYFGVQFLTAFLPLSVKIETRGRKPVVTIHHPVNIDHRHYLKQKDLTQFGTVESICDQFFEKPLHHQ